MKHTLFGFGLCVCLTSCWSTDTIDSEDVNEDVIFGEYSVSFDEAEGELRFYAQFRVGGGTGTTLRLTDPSVVTADGEEMDFLDGDEAWINVEGSYYYLNRAAATQTEGYDFVWTLLDGTEYTNFVETAQPIAIGAPAEGAMVSKSTALVVDFGAALEPGETARCSINSAGEGYEGESVSSGSSCVFTEQELADFDPGPATLSVYRRLDQEIQEGHEEEGGRVTSYYYAPSVDITLTD